MKLQSLRVVDYSDREVLLILHDLADADGWADAADIADRIGLDHEHPVRPVSSRLGWLMRFGAVEREYMYTATRAILRTRAGKPRYTQRWRLTDAGRIVALGQLTRRERDQLESLSPGKMLLATRILTHRQRTSGVTVAKLVDREWKYGTSPERSRNRDREMP